MLGVYETLVKKVDLISLSSKEYCYILDPVDPKTGQNVHGTKKLVKGEKNFFLLPGETIEGGTVHKVCVLKDNESVLI